MPWVVPNSSQHELCTSGGGDALGGTQRREKGYSGPCKSQSASTEIIRCNPTPNVRNMAHHPQSASTEIIKCNPPPNVLNVGIQGVSWDKCSSARLWSTHSSKGTRVILRHRHGAETLGGGSHFMICFLQTCRGVSRESFCSAGGADLTLPDVVFN